MVSAYLVDALRDPTGELQDLFTSASSSATDFPQAVANHFARVFKAETAFQQIPVLSTRHPPESHPHRSLVRFRGMVQDTSPSTEMYLYKSRDGKVGGWGIEQQADDTEPFREVDYACLRESTILWVTSIPGESLWYSEYLEGPGSESDSTPTKHVPARPHKFHDPQESHIGVQVKLYGEGNANLKSTDVASFVGILSLDHLSTELEDPPIVPTLHVLYVRADSEAAPSPPLEHGEGQNAQQIGEGRNQLLRWVAQQALGGDREAAEWVLLSIVASVQARHPPLLPPSITISQFPSPPDSIQSPSPALSHVLSLILPRVVTLPLSLQFLNTRGFIPESKDEDLHGGALQLPKGTVLLVTENGVGEGQLIDKGIANLQALQEVMSTQTLAYDFPFSRFSFPTDISCLVLAEGKKSAFFKTDIIVPLRPQLETIDSGDLWKSEAEVEKPPEELLATFRHMIHVARAGRVQVSAATSEYIQQDFVRDRQRNPAATTADDLIRWMTVAKLHALTFQQTELTIENWERAKELDEKRRSRLT